MAFNVEGSTTFAAAGWSDAIGFANSATLIVANAGGPVVAGLDQTATNPTSLEVLNAWTTDIGTQANPLKFEANLLGTNYFRYRPGGGRCWVAAEDAGGAAKIENLDVGGSGRITLMGGEFEDVTQDGGHIHANQSTTTDSFYAYGGTSRWETHGTAITLAEIYGGTHTIERDVGTLTVGANAEVILNAPGETIATVNMQGGRLVILAGDVATLNGDAGEIDCSRAERAIVLGSTSFVQGGVRVKYDARTTISNVTKPGAFLPPQPI